MLSREFWEDESTPRKSDNFFHSTDYFRSRYRQGAPAGTRPAPGIANGQQIKAQMDQGLLPDEVADFITDWSSRTALWAQARAGWYGPQHKIWKESAWGRLIERSQLHLFSQELKKDSTDRDEFKCFISAHVNARSVEWLQSQAQYFGSLEKTPKAWPWHVIGLLMLAVMPIHSTSSQRPEKGTKVWTAIEPSSTNPNVARTITRGTVSSEWYPTWIPESRFGDPFVGDGMSALGTFIQINYLDLAQKVVNYFTDRGPVSKPWVEEIVRVEAKLRRRRIDLVLEQTLLGGDPSQMWVDDAWDFKMPTYDPREHRFNRESNTWADA
ncbi:hypothetical protein GGR58DRAFT_286592 [Xylaria digitata]|nr:hypothetical protein GGR58DRAFT_286592 [Xylaria digitata]